MTRGPAILAAHAMAYAMTLGVRGDTSVPVVADSRGTGIEPADLGPTITIPPVPAPPVGGWGPRPNRAQRRAAKYGARVRRRP